MGPKRSINKNKSRRIPLNKIPQKRSKIIVDSTISFNKEYSKEFIENISEAYNEKRSYIQESGAALHVEPFPHFILPNFIADLEFVRSLEEELLSLEFHEKNNDLFKFYQTNELKKASSPHIKAFRQMLYKDFLTWLQKVSGIPLSSKIDMTCAKYQYTDTLLCHDDELEGRRIAFIYYLLPSWKKSDGGTLDLFDTDEDGQPRRIVKSLLPENNKLIFFEVSPISFHQVAEVLSKDKVRLSVSGWFHGPPLPPNKPPLPLALPPKQKPGDVEEDVLLDWINPQYLEPNTQGQVQAQFLSNFQVELLDFLKKEKYQSLLKEVSSKKCKWKSLGPPNKRSYEALDEQAGTPSLVNELKTVLCSEAMFLTLSNLTGMALHSLAGGEEATCRIELQQWQHGSYTLVSDDEPEAISPCLDLTLFLDFDGWNPDQGGSVTFLQSTDKADSEENLVVDPHCNSLALVFRNTGHSRFVKYLNHRVGKHRFHSLHAIYYQGSE